MLGNTHITAGITTSLLVFRPTTMLEFVATVAGGAVGGAICDIDCKRSDLNRDTIRGAVLGCAVIAAALVLDLRLGHGIYDYVQKTFGAATVFGLLGFFVCCIWGARSKHRTFTHSLTGGLAMSGCAYLVCKPFGLAMGAGMVSHILLDLLNRRRVQLFYPLKKPRICLNLCDSDGIVNTVLSGIFTLSSSILVPWYAITALGSLGISLR